VVRKIRRRAARRRLSTKSATVMCAGTFLVTAAPVVLHSRPVAAFPFDRGCPALAGSAPVTYSWKFAGAGWTTLDSAGVEFGAQARDGIRDWETARLTNGVRPIDTPESGSGVITISLVDMGITGIAHTPNCTNIEVNNNPAVFPATFQTPGFMKAVVRHEFGHILGIAHTGTTDNYISGEWPAMATCPKWQVNPPNPNFSLASLKFVQDDDAVAHRMFEPRVPIMSLPGGANDLWNWGGGNPGFEHSTTLKHWYFNQATFSTSSTGGANGPKFVKYRPTNVNSQKMYQSQNLVMGRGATTFGVSMRGKAKKLAATDSKDVRLTLNTRTVTYRSRYAGMETTCDWVTGTPPGLNQTHE